MASPLLNILQTCFSYSWGGLEQQALEVSVRMRERGHRVWLACIPGTRLFYEAQSTSVPLLSMRVKGYFHPFVAWTLARFLRAKHIDVIHSHLSKDIATLVPAMKFSREHVPLILSKRVGSYIKKTDLFHRFTYANVARVLAISEVIHRNVLETTPMRPDRVLTIHDAIDTRRFSLENVDRMKVRNEFGFARDTIVIGMVARFSPGKGHEEFLEAADILRRVYSNIHFLVVGEASHGEQKYAQKIRTLRRMRNLESVVTFTGYRSDIPEVLAAFDIFAFPSHAESFGVALIEAMAMELPVVSTNCDGVLDIVVNGTTGFFVHPRNSVELADALARLIENPVLREEFGRAGRKRVEELFDQRRQVERFEAVYYDVLGLGERP
jgi:glycosyltransferase involved in cell wall biosynthesis